MVRVEPERWRRRLRLGQGSRARSMRRRERWFGEGPFDAPVSEGAGEGDGGCEVIQPACRFVRRRVGHLSEDGRSSRGRLRDRQGRGVCGLFDSFEVQEFGQSSDELGWSRRPGRRLALSCRSALRSDGRRSLGGCRVVRGARRRGRGEGRWIGAGSRECKVSSR